MLGITIAWGARYKKIGFRLAFCFLKLPFLYIFFLDFT